MVLPHHQPIRELTMSMSGSCTPWPSLVQCLSKLFPWSHWGIQIFLSMSCQFSLLGPNKYNKYSTFLHHNFMSINLLYYLLGKQAQLCFGTGKQRQGTFPSRMRQISRFEAKWRVRIWWNSKIFWGNYSNDGLRHTKKIRGDSLKKRKKQEK